MRYFEIGDYQKSYSAKEAILKGLGPNGGLFMPQDIPQLDSSFFDSISELSLPEIGAKVLYPFFKDEIGKDEFGEVINEAFNFDVPLVRIDSKTSILEVFHGPTHAFKDIGARFLSRLIKKLERNKTTILVATSGDTGSAVANGFWNVEGVDVVILFPKNGISAYQEFQMTSLGGNIRAYEVDGTFDDCQKLVKESFSNEELSDYLNLTSANSINIARLLPQMVYYFGAYAQLENREALLRFIVPSGNFGNITAGLIAQKMGLPVSQWVAATNENTVFPDYLESGVFRPKKSVKTHSNAMDVGNPSNFPRLLQLFTNDLDQLKENLDSGFVSNKETVDTIREVYKEFAYTLDPHTAVGYALHKRMAFDGQTVVIGTAHPSKFENVVKQAIPGYESQFVIENKESFKTTLRGSFESLKKELMNEVGS